MKRTTLHRKTPLRRAPFLVKAKARPGWAKARLAVLHRAHGLCEAAIVGVCTGTAVDVHHVQRRSQGGNDEPGNLCACCSACHDHIHRNVGWALRTGLLRSAHVRVIDQGDVA